MERQPLSNKILPTFLRFFFRLLYHQFAWTYDYVAALVSLGMWQDWVLSITDDIEGPHILELGFGTGNLQLALNQEYGISFGLDASQQMARKTVRRLHKNSFMPNIVLGYAQNLPIASRTFNHVVSTFPTEYIYDSATLRETYRVLKPGGSFLIVPLAWIKGRSWIHRLSSWLFRRTGQSPEWEDRFLAPIKKAGFLVSIEKRTVKSSQILVIWATKP